MYNNPNKSAENDLFRFETPFADDYVSNEAGEVDFEKYDVSQEFLTLGESPFSRTYESTDNNQVTTVVEEEYVSLLAELHDHEFVESLYEMVNEMEGEWIGEISNEMSTGNNISYINQKARHYFEPVIQESQKMIDQFIQHFSGNNLADYKEGELESYFTNLEFEHSHFTPAQEQFLGKVFNKVKSVVKKGVNLAKKGINAVGKILPINKVLEKIKGLIKPLLDRVLKFAIGKLPKNLQPHAQTLAKKFLKMELENWEEEGNLENNNDLDALQYEFDNRISHLLFSTETAEAEFVIMEYEASDLGLAGTNTYEMDNQGVKSLDSARQRFIEDLRNLQPGDSPAPAIERFLPAAILALQPVIKIAISVIGRQRVINFLAGILAKLVAKYVPANVAKPLAASIIDVGMGAIGFEVYETDKMDLAYEAIANTIEQTIQGLEIANEASINDTEELTMGLLQAFEKAAADNFPPQYIKEEIRPSKQKALWVAMPRGSSKKLYKKFTHVFNVSITPPTASSVITFRNLPLVNFFRDKYGLDTSKPIKAKVHLYEVLGGGRLNMISKFEKLPGLNANQTKSWIQLLPLTKQAAGLLLNEPALGRDVPKGAVSTRFHNPAGQRFYYLEIEGAKLRIPPVNRSKHKHLNNGQPPSSTESRSADIQAVLNFVKSEIKINYYFSEEDAKSVVEKLNRNDFLGTAMLIRQSIKGVLDTMLKKNISSKVKIVHEAVPELYMENFQDLQENFDFLPSLGKMAGKEIISKILEKFVDSISQKAYSAIIEFFKTKSKEFKEAQSQPQDGVTIKITWSNVPGMAPIRTVIKAIRGKGSIGNLAQLSIPNFQSPVIRVTADKQFD